MDTAIAVAPPPNDFLDAALSQVQAEEKLFALAQRRARVYSESTIVPKAYQGNIGNVLIAENMSKRLGADLLMVMQNLYVVYGNVGWSAQFLIACFNSNGRFSAIKYRFQGEPNKPDWGCQAYCTERSTGEVIEGTWVTWAMANAEGWVNKQGSKWKTMPEQMFRYRAATFMIRATAPEIGMGLLTKEELEDMPAAAEIADVAPKLGVAGLKDRMQLTDAGEIVDTATGEVIETEAVELETPIEPETISEPNDRPLDPDPPVDELAELYASAKDKINNLTNGEAAKVAELLNGRVLNSFDLKQLKSFHKELDKKLEAAA